MFLVVYIQAVMARRRRVRTGRGRKEHGVGADARKTKAKMDRGGWHGGWNIGGVALPWLNRLKGVEWGRRLKKLYYCGKPVHHVCVCERERGPPNPVTLKMD